MKHFYSVSIISVSLRKSCILLLCMLMAIAVNATDYYWVGGSGKWSDKQHWASTSGGQGGTGNIPSLNDNVLFNGASGFLRDSAIITIDTVAFCNSIRWNELQVTPKLIINANLLIDSAIAFQPRMIISGTNATVSFTNSSKTKIMSGANDVTVIWDNGFWFNGWPFPPPPPGDKKQ